MVEPILPRPPRADERRPPRRAVGGGPADPHALEPDQGSQSFAPMAERAIRRAAERRSTGARSTEGRAPSRVAPPPAPAPVRPTPESTTPAPLPTWGTWREPVQGKLPGIDACTGAMPARAAVSARRDGGTKRRVRRREMRRCGSMMGGALCVGSLSPLMHERSVMVGPSEEPRPRSTRSLFFSIYYPTLRICTTLTVMESVLGVAGGCLPIPGRA
jgi:hypothetical protein